MDFTQTIDEPSTSENVTVPRAGREYLLEHEVERLIEVAKGNRPAQYESWSMPFMVILAVPLALLGAVLALWLRGRQIDVYSQVGFVMLVGLAAKNAILIVEFAKHQREEGKSIVEAAMEAARLRLRPILMTAFAFVLGVIPLMTASGAGAAARQSIGTTVFGGMLVATILSLAFVPVFYAVIEGLREGARIGREGKTPSSHQPSLAETH
jgi:Cu/Ag efflux pump CusA